jgi:hypothetical protein
MTIIREVREAISAVSESIDHIQTISEAIKKGKDYLKTQHPHVASDLAAMCEEMSKSSQALASASSIITHFRFVIGDIRATEAARFNEHLVNHKTQAETLKQRIRSMRGSCGVIRQHAEEIGQKAIPNGLTTIAAALGLHSEKREQELADALQGIYNEEMQYHRGVVEMANAVRIALKAIQDELGPAGVIDPGKVPNAAAVLGEYATAFANLEARCNYNALELQASIDELQGRHL